MMYIYVDIVLEMIDIELGRETMIE